MTSNASAGDVPAATGPLAGITVVDLTVGVLGPVATQTLGDMGADVIKVELPTGDTNRQIGKARSPNMGSYYVTINRNKRSVVLNLKRPAALEALMRLVETADVFVHSMRTDAAERLGIGYKAIAARNPRIIYAFAPGYRSDGPYRDRPAFDDIIQGEAGLADLVGRAGGEPRFIPTVITDKFTGFTVASAIGMALYHRERTGEGQQIQVPMFENLLSFLLIEHLWNAAYDGDPRNVGYTRLLTPHRRPYATADGYICIMANSDAHWERLFPALGVPELAGDTRFAKLAERSQHFDELYAIVAERCRLQTTAQLRAALDQADVPNGAMKTLEELMRDPYLAETGFFHHYAHPTDGPLVTTSIPVQFSGTPGNIRRPPPTLGEHTRELLKQVGYSDLEIESIND